MSSNKPDSDPAVAPAGGPSPPDFPPSADKTNRLVFYTGAALSFLVSLGFYIRTMAASASFWDSGEFIAAASTLAIPHSPGTPLYVLAGRVFTLLPIPISTAQKVNLLSVFCGALGVLFVYLLIVRFQGLLSRQAPSPDRHYY